MCVFDCERYPRRTRGQRARIDLGKRMDTGTALSKNDIFIVTQQVTAITKPGASTRERWRATRIAKEGLRRQDDATSTEFISTPRPCFSRCISKHETRTL